MQQSLWARSVIKKDFFKTFRSVQKCMFLDYSSQDVMSKTRVDLSSLQNHFAISALSASSEIVTSSFIVFPTWLVFRTHKNLKMSQSSSEATLCVHWKCSIVLPKLKHYAAVLRASLVQSRPKQQYYVL